MVLAKKSQDRRKQRIRTKLRKVNSGRLRLTVYRSNSNIYAQIIDDEKASTLATASTVDKDIKKAIKNGSNKEAAVAVGQLIAKRATKAGISEVYFDRSGYLYHGRVKALADAARENGLSF
ncbi:MAG: 50S ribosomal protein L18 [Alphaproteobacteria bacterium]|jgi:large subunit ribosomal protein L18|nr:50S ribosomal protein L18 [Alphaproteobacteria bacterium]